MIGKDLITEEIGLLPYLIRVLLALAIMAVVAFVVVALGKKKGWVRQNEAHVKMMASLPLGKDVFFVLRCGPDVLAVASGQTGTRLIGRWKYEEWLRLEETGEKGGRETKTFPE